MKRILLHLAVSALAFGLGSSVSALTRVYISVDAIPPVVVDVSEWNFDVIVMPYEEPCPF
jgi:hypothetical protein